MRCLVADCDFVMLLCFGYATSGGLSVMLGLVAWWFYFVLCLSLGFVFVGCAVVV